MGISVAVLVRAIVTGVIVPMVIDLWPKQSIQRVTAQYIFCGQVRQWARQKTFQLRTNPQHQISIAQAAITFLALALNRRQRRWCASPTPIWRGLCGWSPSPWALTHAISRCSPLAAQVAAESRLVIRAGEEAGSTAQLKVSPERKRNMIAADILEGVPVVGAVVFFPTTEKVVSTEPPRLEAYGVGAVDLGGGGSGGAVAGGSGADGALADDELPPLGEPSGPVEQVPDFPDLELPGELPQ